MTRRDGATSTRGSRLVHAISLFTACALVSLCALAQDAELRTLTTTASAELKYLNTIHEKTWGMGEARDVVIDQGRGTIVWSLDDEQSVEAPVQIIGTYDPSTMLFVWAWANHTILPKLHEGANRVREYGIRHDVAELTARSVRVLPARAWEFAAIANHLARAKGAYPVSTGGIVVYVTFGKIRLVNGAR